MQLYPIFADLRDRPVLVVGGGGVAERKARTLLDAGARVSVGAPWISAGLRQLLALGRLHYLAGEFASSWLEHQWLVVAASNEAAVNRAVADAAAARRLFVNVVDDAELSTFHVPAVVARGPLTVAISSGGGAPALARRLREKFETLLDASLGDLVALATRERAHIKTRYPDPLHRRRFFDWLWQGPVARLLRAGQTAHAEQLLRTRLTSDVPLPVDGSVTLVGAGPGDPGLITLRALRALQSADVVLYDRLISDEVLNLARREAQLINVGKQTGADPGAQDRIHALMREHTAQGQHVVRLKGGDPLLFGRGGEELEFLRAQDIPYEVVPGITAAFACAAYAGIPLTHRAHAHAVHFITAHHKDSLDDPDWHALAREQQTLVVYMGAGRLDVLTRKLLTHGRAAQTPFALVENGSRPEQRVVTGVLSQLPAVVREHAIAAPALLIVGEVAASASQLAWFGSPPVSSSPIALSA